MTYNINITNFNDFLVFPNTVTGNWFWTLILVAEFVIIFVAFKSRYANDQSFAGASFITTISTFILFFMELTTATVLITSIAMSIIGLISLIVSGSKDF